MSFEVKRHKDAKTEDPTAKRMAKAWSEGNIPVSQEVKSVSMLLGALIVVAVLAPWMMKSLTVYMRTFLESPETMQVDVETFQTFAISVMAKVGVILAFPALVLVIAACAGTMGQIGLNFTPDKIAFNLNNINPIAGFSRLFSTTSLIEAVKGVAKMLIVALLIGFFVVPTMSHPDKLMDQDVPATLKELHRLVVMILFLVVIVMVTLAAADYAYQRWQHKEKLKMTKQEVKDEHKEQEGDPKVKGRIRNLRLERHRHRMMTAIPKASVIITNPTHYAVALQYDMEAMGAPKVVAKGVDYLAKRIRQIAETHEVPIVEKGAHFTLYLPRVEETEAMVAAGQARAAAAAKRARGDNSEAALAAADLGGHGNILLVEDEDAVRVFAARALKNKGYKVLEARTGEQALDILRDTPAVDLMITDMMMPGMDGGTLARLIRVERPEIRIIVISGYSEEVARGDIVDTADFHFLPKPFSLGQLASKVKDVLTEA